MVVPTVPHARLAASGDDTLTNNSVETQVKHFLREGFANTRLDKMNPETTVFDVWQEMNNRERVEDFQPPNLQDEQRYKQFLEITPTLKETKKRWSSRRMLNREEQRSPTSHKSQLYDLSLSGSFSEAFQRNADPTINTELPGGKKDTRMSVTQELSRREKSLDLRASQFRNSFERSLLILGERLMEMEGMAKSNKRKANTEQFRMSLSKLLRDTHRVYCLLAATLTLLNPDLENCEERVGSLDLCQFESFDYGMIEEETDTAIGMAMIQRWFSVNGKLHKVFQIIDKDLQGIKKERIPLAEFGLSDAVFNRIDDALTRCLERIDSTKEFLSRFDIHNATTTVLAALRWRKLSPKNQRNKGKPSFS